MYTDRKKFDYKSFGGKIKKARKKVGYSQNKLGELTDLSDNYISDIERGIKHPTIPTVIDLSNCLQINPNELFYPWMHTCIQHNAEIVNSRLNGLLPEQQVMVINVMEKMIEGFEKLNNDH